jgi:L-cystine transport system ATP-binding protein
VAQRIPREAAQDQSIRILEKIGLNEKLKAYPSEISGGQQQRVGIARALALNPKVILFDEPTSALDPELVGEVLQAIKRVAREGITMIVVTHEIDFALDIATKVVFMDGGLIVEQGMPDEVISHPKEERTRQFLRRLLPETSFSI